MLKRNPVPFFAHCSITNFTTISIVFPLSAMFRSKIKTLIDNLKPNPMTVERKTRIEKQLSKRHKVQPRRFLPGRTAMVFDEVGTCDYFTK